MKTIKDLTNFKNNFKIEEIDDDSELNLESSIEKLKVYNDENGKRYVKRNWNKTEVSNKYFPVPDSYILSNLFNQDYFDSISDQIDKLIVEEHGGFTLLFKNEIFCDKEVLDIKKKEKFDYSTYMLNNIDNLDIDINNFGSYNKMLKIFNSYDKSKRFSIALGLIRLICINGIFSLKESEGNHISSQILHLNCNKDLILTSIEDTLKKIPTLLEQTDLPKELSEQELNTNLKNEYFDIIKKYLNERKEKDIEKNSKYSYYPYEGYLYLDSFIKIIEQIMEKGKTMLDFVNVMSYFQVKGRFTSNVKSTAVILQNKMKKLYNK